MAAMAAGRDGRDGRARLAWPDVAPLQAWPDVAPLQMPAGTYRAGRRCGGGGGTAVGGGSLYNRPGERLASAQDCEKHGSFELGGQRIRGVTEVSG
jgi:hypothetical protein